MMCAEKAIGPTLSQVVGDLAKVRPSEDVQISGLTLDSRKLVAGDCFVALSGAEVSGIDYLDDVVRAGASAVLVDTANNESVAGNLLKAPVPVLGIPNLAHQVSALASRFYGEPSKHMTVIGITGTNGKTSVAHLVAEGFDHATKSEAHSNRCGLFGTLGHGYFGELQAAPNTTIDPISLQEALAQLYGRGTRVVVMEVSSHGLVQGRVNGIAFDVAVFTNLSHDHLDYHGTLDNYIEAKRLLFSQDLRAAIVNADDAVATRMLDSVGPDTRVIGFSQQAEPKFYGPLVTARDVLISDTGIRFTVDTPLGVAAIDSALLGRVNVGNLLAALAVLISIDIPLADAVASLNQATPVRGRLQQLGGGKDPVVVVDYAHTPDALERTLLSLREACAGELWCVFGCGGDRDNSKRPLMGAISERYADHTILTDDNPRFESSQSIIADVLAGFTDPSQPLVINDRAAAITTAIEQATQGDVVLIAGKGHEEYQQIADQKFALSDANLASLALKHRLA